MFRPHASNVSALSSAVAKSVQAMPLVSPSPSSDRTCGFPASYVLQHIRCVLCGGRGQETALAYPTISDEVTPQPAYNGNLGGKIGDLSHGDGVYGIFAVERRAFIQARSGPTPYSNRPNDLISSIRQSLWE